MSAEFIAWALFHFCREEVPVFTMATQSQLIGAKREWSQVHRRLKRRHEVTNYRFSDRGRLRTQTRIEQLDLIFSWFRTDGQKNREIGLGPRQRYRACVSLLLISTRDRILAKVDFHAPLG